MIEWRNLREFPNYAINQYGRVRNIQTGRVLKNTVNSHGIIKVGLRRDGQQQWRSVAFLVAQNFLPDPPDRYVNPTVIHLDGDRENVGVDNLMWRSRSFALAYHKQFHERSWLKINEPVVHVLTGMVFDDSFEAAVSFGMLEQTVAKMVYRSESKYIQEREDALFRRLEPKY
jgi:NUMOD4 motif